MIKLLNAELMHESASGKAICIRVELQGGADKTLWFPFSEISIESDMDGNRRPSGDIYVEPWLLEKKEEEIGDYILTEK